MHDAVHGQSPAYIKNVLIQILRFDQDIPDFDLLHQDSMMFRSLEHSLDDEHFLFLFPWNGTISPQC